MKRCVRCGHIDDDEKEFCENDGTLLAYEQQPPKSPARKFMPQMNAGVRWAAAPRKTLLTAAVGIFVGLTIAAVAFAIFYASARRAEPATSDERTAQRALHINNQPAVTARLPSGENKKEIRPVLNGSPSPQLSPTPSPEPTLSPSPTPTPQTDAALDRAAGPAAISTGGKKERVNRDLVTIHLASGKSIEVDDAWEDAQGVWYRRGSFVSLVERGHVRAVKRRPASERSPIPEPTP